MSHAPTPPNPDSIEDVEAFNDQLAKDHDIDDYYARSSWPIRFIEQRRLDAIVSLLDVRRGEKLIEVGCGGGHVLRCFPQAKITGVDVSGRMLEKARRNLQGYDATLLHGQLSELALEDGSFDAMVCTEVLEHIVDPQAVLRDMVRLLRPGGRVVLTFPNDKLINGVKGVVGKSPLRHVPPFSGMYWGGDHYHLHVWSIPEMRQLLRRYFEFDAERLVPSPAFPIRCCFLGHRPA